MEVHPVPGGGQFVTVSKRRLAIERGLHEIGRVRGDLRFRNLPTAQPVVQVLDVQVVGRLSVHDTVSALFSMHPIMEPGPSGRERAADPLSVCVAEVKVRPHAGGQFGNGQTGIR